MRTARVILRFHSHAEGGRMHPPTGPVYSTVARFARRERYENWSIVAQIQATPDPEGWLTTEIELLSPDGPVDVLQSGTAFTLIEGARTVATGQVIAEQFIADPHTKPPRYRIRRELRDLLWQGGSAGTHRILEDVVCT